MHDSVCFWNAPLIESAPGWFLVIIGAALTRRVCPTLHSIVTLNTSAAHHCSVLPTLVWRQSAKLNQMQITISSSVRFRETSSNLSVNMSLRGVSSIPCSLVPRVRHMFEMARKWALWEDIKGKCGRRFLIRSKCYPIFIISSLNTVNVPKAV